MQKIGCFGVKDPIFQEKRSDLFAPKIKTFYFHIRFCEIREPEKDFPDDFFRFEQNKTKQQITPSKNQPPTLLTLYPLSCKYADTLSL